MNWFRLLPILLAFALRLVPGPRIVDDAYITFRYAQNLAAGNGLVYNAGEMVLGTTTPLYTLLLAGLSRVLRWEDLPHLAWALNALVDTVGVALILWLGGKLSAGRGVGVAAAFWWAVAPYSVTFAVGGLETSLVITLLLASFAFALVGNDTWCALVLGLGILTRPDFLIAALPIVGAAGWRWLRERCTFRRDAPPAGEPGGSGLVRLLGSLPYQPAAILVAVLAPWLVYATAVYGSPLPNSLSAKAAAYHLPPEAALVRLLQHFGTPFHEYPVLGVRWVAVGLVLYGTLSAIGGLEATRRNSRAWPLFFYPVLYAAIYAVANPLIFRWYLSPPVPFYYLGIMVGVHAVASQAGRWRAYLPGVLTAGAALLALASLGNAWTPHPPGPPDRPAPEMAWIELEILYQQVALDLKPELVETGGQLAAGDIGTLGWFTDAPVLDLVGLVSPQAAGFYPLADADYVIAYAVSPDYILAERPDYVVVLEVYGRNTLAKDPRFLAEYTLKRVYPTDIYGSTGMLVYQLARGPA